MKKQFVLLLVSSITAGMIVAQSLAQSAKPVTINFYSGGDVNVKNLWEVSLFPLYQKQNPNVQFNLIFSQAGAGNQAMIDRMAAKNLVKPPGSTFLRAQSLRLPIRVCSSQELLTSASQRKTIFRLDCFISSTNPEQHGQGLSDPSG